MSAIQTAYAPRGDVDQRVYTPVTLIERVLLKVWPEGIAYDPFPGDMAPVSTLAERCCRGDGYVEHWLDRSYANPPFNRLKEAMARAALMGHGGRLPRPSFDEPLETMLLGPAQTHRVWFWEHRGMATAWLRPLKFQGFASTYPKPLCLHYWGARIEQFEHVVRESGMAVHVDRKAA